VLISGFLVAKGLHGGWPRLRISLRIHPRKRQKPRAFLRTWLLRGQLWHGFGRVSRVFTTTQPLQC
jgi:hypothetical protein